MPTRRQYSGNASAQTLTADLTSVATTATISSSTGWPNGSVGPFAVVIDRGTNSEEKCLCSGLSGNTLTIQTRGYDGTGGAAHSNGATVELCLTAVDLDEANAHTSAVAGVHGVSGNVVGTTDIQTLANKTLTEPAITDWTLANHTHQTASQGGTLPIAYSGTYTWSAASSFVSFAHGAPFAPSTAITQITAHTGGGTDHVWGLVVDGDISTTLVVSFQSYSTGGPITLNSGTLHYTVFA